MTSFFRRTQSGSHQPLNQQDQDDELDAAFQEDAPNDNSSSRRYDNLSSDSTSSQTPLTAASNDDYPPVNSAHSDSTSRYNFETSPMEDHTSVPSSTVDFPSHHHHHATSTTLSAHRNQSLRDRIAQATNKILGRYNPLSTQDPDHHHTVGGRRVMSGPGYNDGVFANLAAKPERRRQPNAPEYVGGDDEVGNKEAPPVSDICLTCITCAQSMMF